MRRWRRSAAPGSLRTREPPADGRRSRGPPGGGTRARRPAAPAAQVRAELATRVGLAAIAPDAAEGFKPGSVFLAADIDGVLHAEMVMLQPDRRRMREFSVISLLNLLRRNLSS